MCSSVKHNLFPSRVEECRLSLKQILNGKRRVSICVKSVDCELPKRKVAYISKNNIVGPSNNDVEHLSIDKNVAKSFNILTNSLSVSYNYFL